VTIKKRNGKQLINTSQEKRQSGTDTSFSPGTWAFSLTISLKMIHIHSPVINKILYYQFKASFCNILMKGPNI
jgi:hypothetical protein